MTWRSEDPNATQESAAAFAALQSALAVPSRVRPSRIGMRAWGTKQGAFDNTAAYTFEETVALAAPFDAVRIGFAFGQNTGGTATAATMLASVGVVADTSDAAANAATYTGVTVAGAGTWSAAVSSAFGRRNIILSDKIAISSIPRTDGGPGALLVIRSWINGGSALVLNGQQTVSIANWASHPSGRVRKVRRSATGGNFASTNQSAFGTSASSPAAPAINVSPVMFVVYYARNRVVSLATFGDSIDEDQGTYNGAGWGLRAALALSTSLGVPVEHAQFAFAGVSSSEIRYQVTDLLAKLGPLGLAPPLAMVPRYTPNDQTTTLSQAAINVMRQRQTDIDEACRLYGTTIVRRSSIPTDTLDGAGNPLRPYGATDSFRVGYDDEGRDEKTNYGDYFVDVDPIFRGALVDGQYQMAPAYSLDHIHPNDAGYEASYQLVVDEVERAVGLARP